MRPALRSPKIANWRVNAALALILFSANAALAAESLPPPPTTRSGQAHTESQFRTWTDRTGERTATAVLLEIKGKTIFLRKSNGKLATTTFDSLSPADQRHIVLVQSRTRSQFQAPKKISAAQKGPHRKPLIEEWIDRFRIPSLGAIVGRLSPNATPRPDNSTDQSTALAPLPENLVYVEISRGFLREYVERSVRRDTTVSDHILATSITGSAHTEGATDLVLQSAQDRAVADVVFTGTIRSQTIGYNGPIVLHNTAQTQFYAHKQLTLTQDGLQVLPTVSQAHTSSATHCIDSCLPGLRGRITERVAWRRADEMRPQANAIASRHAEARINRALDARVNKAIVAARKTLAEYATRLPYDRDHLAPLIRFNSTPEYVQIVMCRTEATPEERRIHPPPMAGNAALSARVHRVVLRRAITDPELQQSLAPFLKGLINNQSNRQTTAMAKASAPEPQYELNWSSDGNWLMLQFNANPTGPNQSTTDNIHATNARVQSTRGAKE